MAMDMDIDIGKIFKDLLSKGKSTNGSGLAKGPYAKIITSGVLVFAILLIYVFLFYIPSKSELTDKEMKISQIEDLRIEILELSSKVSGEELALNKAKNTFEKLQGMFHSKTEIEDIYRQVSTAALRNKLLISKLSKLERSPVFMAEKSLEAIDTENYSDGGNDPYEGEYMDENTTASNKKQVAFYDFKIILDISGNYSKYLKFRRQLSELKKLLIVIQEDIVVLKSERRKGDIKATLVLRTYQMPENESERYIKSEEVM